jgi:hypothetical protein
MNRAKPTAEPLPVTVANSTFHVENEFSQQASSLRSQFEEHISLCSRDHAGVTPLAYVFSPQRYQLLTTAAEHVFAAETLQALIEGLRDWGQDKLGTSHVSTPQLRVYIDGCARTLLQDDVMLGWHYKLSLTRMGHPPAGGRVQVMIGNSRNKGRSKFFSVSEFIRSRLTFNQLLVHDTRSAYGVEPVKSSMNPLDGVIFLDGYLW